MIQVSGTSLIIFGCSLLGQAGLATWALATTRVPTWSSNPLDTVYACTDETNPNVLLRRLGRCMMSVHQRKLPMGAYEPKERQGPACTAHSEVKWVLGLLWLLVPLGGLWAGVIYLMIKKGNSHGILGDSWSFLPVFTGTLYPEDTCHGAARCTAGTSVLNVGWTGGNHGYWGAVGKIFLIAAFQALVTLALHCAELLVNLSRDEGIFRRAITPRGTDPRYNSIKAAFSSWQTLVLFAFKAAVHWLFGLAINADFTLGLNMYPPQIVYFTAFTLSVGLFAGYVSLRRPRGMLPATYGHLQTVADLIDEWGERMFWGHKEDGNPNYAGTSRDPLPMPRKGELYGGMAGLSRKSLASETSMESLSSARWSPNQGYNSGMYNF